MKSPCPEDFFQGRIWYAGGLGWVRDRLGSNSKKQKSRNCSDGRNECKSGEQERHN